MLAEELENSIVRGKCRINRQSANQRGRPASHRCGLCASAGVLGKNPLWKSGRQFARNIVVLSPQRSWEPLPAQLALCGLSFSWGATSERRLSPETFLRKPSLGATTRMPFRQPPELGKGPICPSCVATARSEEHTSELQSHLNLVCRLLLEKKKKKNCISQDMKYSHARVCLP